MDEYQEMIRVLNKKLPKYSVTKLLGKGTVGTVFLSCVKKKNSHCYAMKVQKIRNKEEERNFLAESSMQTLFDGIGPTLYESITITSRTSNTKYGVIIMDLLGDTLDVRLANPRLSVTDIDAIASQITGIFKELKRRRITHGDLALFNFAFDDGDNLKLVDFDRSSAQYHPMVDFLRVHLELFLSKLSIGTTRIPANVLRRLRSNVPEWGYVLFNRETTIEKADVVEQLWIEEYERYCKKAKVKCLAS